MTSQKPIKGLKIGMDSNRTTSKKQQQTAIGMSNKFQQINLGSQVKQFSQDGAETKIYPLNPKQATYPKWNLLKDINYLNSIYNHILIMISSHVGRGEKKSYQMVKMSRQIQTTIMENIKLKQQIDASYQNANNLQEIADYLHINITQAQGELKQFINAYQRYQQEAKNSSIELQKQLNSRQQKSSAVVDELVKQKQKKVKAYRKMIERQKDRIAKYEQQQKNLLKKLYKTQRQIIKNEHSSSAIKLKINEVKFSQEKKIRSKTKQCKTAEKENVPVNKQKRSMKIQQSQKLQTIRKNII